MRGVLKASGAAPLAPYAGEMPAANARAGLILQSEAASELGAPGTESVLALVYTNDVHRDAVYVVGGEKLETGSFGLVAVISGKELDAETFYQITLRFPRLADHPGWMVKIDKTRIWVRVGRDAPGEALPRAAAVLTQRIHAAFDKVGGVELFFINGDEALIEKLQAPAEECRTVLRQVKTGVWKDRGFDYESCELSGHCGSCSDKKTCASVRSIEARVKLLRKEQSKKEQ